MRFLGQIKTFLINNKREAIYILLLLALTVPLRFINLGYSDYIGDEHKSFIEPSEGETVKEFFLTRRKGPMQFLISSIPVVITGTYRDEFAIRTPYALFSIMSVLMFYALVKKFTKNKEVALVSSILLSLNGFIVGFGRIAQYQNLNLFFSFAALYYYLDLLESGKNYLKSTLKGTLMFTISLFAHWDAVFVIPQMIIIFTIFLFSKQVLFKEKLKIILANFVFGCVLILPFLIPYWETQKKLPENIRYLSRRLDVGYDNVDEYLKLIDLYNPFITLEFLVVTGILGVFWFKKSWSHTVWFVVVFAIFELFVRKPGTHIYNFLIPVFILSGIGIVNLIKVSPKYLKKFLIGIFSILVAFFFYQSYIIFVDHKVEYPWSRETLLTFLCKDMQSARVLGACGRFVVANFETPDYGIEDKLPLFGFPLSRKWNEINEIIKQDKIKNLTGNYGFQTNEEKTVSQRYMDHDYRADNGFYIVGIKKPLSFYNDYSFSHIGGKVLITEVKNSQGELLAKIWRLDPPHE